MNLQILKSFHFFPPQKSMQTLMENLISKAPHYIRCIKPNEEKKSGLFDDKLCLHQVRYLGFHFLSHLKASRT
jgi:myosin-1